MVKVGDNHWYGKTVPQNITFAAEMYAEAAAKNGLPQVRLLCCCNIYWERPIGHVVVQNVLWEKIA